MNTCTICFNNVKQDIKVSDYFLTKEKFALYLCPKCLNKFTFPIPKKIINYYKSDNYISHNSNKNNVKTVIYKIIRHIMLNYKYKKLFKYLHGKNILDYGCGNGHFLQFLLDMKENIWGFDNNKEVINQYDKEIKNRVFSDDKDVFSQSYETITLWHVLEHIENPSEFIQKISANLKNGGHLIIAVPNYNSYDANHYKQYWAGYDVPRHLTHFSTQGLTYLLDIHNFVFVNKLPLIFDAFYVSLLSEQYKKTNFSWLKAIKNGMISNIKALKTKEYSSNIFIFRKNESN